MCGHAKSSSYFFDVFQLQRPNSILREAAVKRVVEFLEFNIPRSLKFPTGGAVCYYETEWIQKFADSAIVMNSRMYFMLSHALRENRSKK